MFLLALVLRSSHKLLWRQVRGLAFRAEIKLQPHKKSFTAGKNLQKNALLNLTFQSLSMLHIGQCNRTRDRSSCLQIHFHKEVLAVTVSPGQLSQWALDLLACFATSRTSTEKYISIPYEWHLSNLHSILLSYEWIAHTDTYGSCSHAILEPRVPGISFVSTSTGSLHVQSFFTATIFFFFLPKLCKQNLCINDVFLISSIKSFL